MVVSNYGMEMENFGLVVDFAETFLSTDAAVPTTKNPLPFCSCVDVTGAEERKSFIFPEGEVMDY